MTFQESTPHPHPALGIDHGAARIGIAATDVCGILAHPVETIDCGRVDPIERIADIVAVRGIRVLVLGLPRRMDGSEGTSAAKVRAFAALLHVLQEQPNVTFEPLQKPAIATDIGMFAWLLGIVEQNPVLIIVAVAILAVAAYLGWWKRKY